MKQIFMYAIFFLTAVQLPAQERGWEAGLYTMAGKTIFSDFDTDVDNFNNGTFKLGVLGQYAPNDRIRWRLGLGFAYAAGGYETVRGGTSILGFPVVKERYKVGYKFTHVSVPVEMLLDLNRNPGGFYLLFGPDIRFKLRQKAEETTWLEGTGEPFTKSISSGITNPGVDLFGSLGLGYVFHVGERYNLFVQPVLTTNVGGEVLAAIKGRKQLAGYVTLYEFGVQLGMTQRF